MTPLEPLSEQELVEACLEMHDLIKKHCKRIHGVKVCVSDIQAGIDLMPDYKDIVQPGTMDKHFGDVCAEWRKKPDRIQAYVGIKCHPRLIEATAPKTRTYPIERLTNS